MRALRRATQAGLAYFAVVFAIVLPSLLYIWWEGIPLATVSQRVLYALDSFPLVAVPVFIFVGNLMNALSHRIGRDGLDEDLLHEIATILDEAAQRIERVK